jgi:nucleoside 2-deoxyribosyltransferase
LAYAAHETIHLAVIDVRLIDNDDEDDYSGIYLADDLPKAICKVITTAQPWADMASLMDRARRRDEQGRALAYEFKAIDDYDHEELLKVVTMAFKTERDIRIDPNLKLEISRSLSWETMVDQLKMSGNRGSNGNQKSTFTRQKGVQILKDLTCRLFSPPDEEGPDVVKFLSTTPGYSPCTVAMVRPSFGGAQAIELAVKFGPIHSIQTEVTNFKKYVKPFIPLESRTNLEYGPVWSHDTGALAYVFVGTSVDSVETLRNYYRSSNVSDADLCKTIEHLFRKTCGRWYRQRRKLPKEKPQRLDVLYRMQLHLRDLDQVKKMKEAFLQLVKGEPTGPKIFKLLGKEGLEVQLKDKLRLPNPVKFCFETKCSSGGAAKKSGSGSQPNFFPLISEYAITHGDLHSGNVVVNKDGGTWLIDFYKTGVGHALRDFAEMESDIKFTLMSGNMNARYELEKALLSPKSLPEPLELEKPSAEQRRALRAIQKLRQLASELTDLGDVREYYMALLFYALKAIGGFTSGSSSGQSYSPARAQALLSAALICQKLSSASPDKKGAIFLAHEYSSTFRKVIHSRLKRFVEKMDFEVIHPLDGAGGGGLWSRTAAMIDDADAGFYEISTGNGNVYFELGYALGAKKPYFALIKGNGNPLNRPALIVGDLVHEYGSDATLNKRVRDILSSRDDWKNWFFFMRPGARDATVGRQRPRLALLIAANTPRQSRNFTPLLKSILETYGWTVEVIRLEAEANVESFRAKMLRAKLVVGCLASDRAANARFANAELALALGIAHGMRKLTIILQERNCKVLTDLAALTVTFRGLADAAEILEGKLREMFPRRNVGKTPKRPAGMTRTGTRRPHRKTTGS